MRRIRRRVRFDHKAPPEFHMQADWAVIGVFVMEALKEAAIVAVPMLAIAVILAVFFGGES